MIIFVVPRFQRHLILYTRLYRAGVAKRTKKLGKFGRFIARQSPGAPPVGDDGGDVLITVGKLEKRGTQEDSKC